MAKKDDFKNGPKPLTAVEIRKHNAAIVAFFKKRPNIRVTGTLHMDYWADEYTIRLHGGPKKDRHYIKLTNAEKKRLMRGETLKITSSRSRAGLVRPHSHNCKIKLRRRRS